MFIGRVAIDIPCIISFIGNISICMLNSKISI